MSIGPNLVYSKEINNLPIYIQQKLIDLLEDLGLEYSLNNNSFIINFKNQVEFEKISLIIEKIKKAETFFEALDVFPDLDVSDLFLKEDYIPIEELIPFLESFSSKGIVFDFNQLGQNDFAIDSIDTVKLISKKEYEKLIALENHVYFLWAEKANSKLAEDWLLKIGFNFLYKQNKAKDNVPIEKTELAHIVDYLNSFEYNLGLVEDLFAQGNIQKEAFLNRKKSIIHEQKEAQKSSYLENLIKANVWVERESKKLTTEEDWSGIRKVYSYKQYDFYQLLSDKAKDRESSYLKHCVGQGGYDFVSGIYSVRDENNLPVATIECGSDFSIEQIQGPLNNDISSAEELEAIRFFISNFLDQKPEHLDDIINTGWSVIPILFQEEGGKENTLAEYELFYPQALSIKDSYKYIRVKMGAQAWDQALIESLYLNEYSEAVIAYIKQEISKNPIWVIADKIIGVYFKEPQWVFSPNYKKIINLYTFLEKYPQLLTQNAKNKIKDYQLKISNNENKKEINQLINDIHSFLMKILIKPEDFFKIKSKEKVFIQDYFNLIFSLGIKIKERQSISYLLDIFIKNKLDFPGEIYRSTFFKELFDLEEELTIKESLMQEKIDFVHVLEFNYKIKKCLNCNEATTEDKLSGIHDSITTLVNFIYGEIAHSKIPFFEDLLNEFKSRLNLPLIYLEFTFGNRGKSIKMLEQEIYFICEKIKNRPHFDFGSFKSRISNLHHQIEDFIIQFNEVVNQHKNCEYCLSKQNFLIKQQQYQYEIAEKVKSITQVIDLIEQMFFNENTSEQTFDVIINNLILQWTMINKRLF